MPVSSRHHMRLAGWLLGCALWAFGGAARANDFDQFQNARVAYESQNYELAADLFEGLLSEAGEHDDRPLTVESRKYLAATYLFLGQDVQAQAQIERLLQAEPDYVLDPLAFPAEFNKLFAAVKERLEQQRARESEDRARRAAAQERQERVEAEQRRERLRRLIELASSERVERLHSRWVALLPFGVGQFQNGHHDLGMFFAVTQGVLLATGVVSYLIHEDLADLDQRGDPLTAEALEAAERDELLSRYVNQISLGLFAATALTGIIEAQIRFKPSHTYDRPRPLPPDLRDLKVSLGPAGFSLRGRF